MLHNISITPKMDGEGAQMPHPVESASVQT